MTETGAGACVIASKEPRLVGRNCFGRAQDFVQIRLVDELLQDVPAGAPGELLVRSSSADPRLHFLQAISRTKMQTARLGKAIGFTQAIWCWQMSKAICSL